ncbi:hypothetical protein E1287_11905 [Actinomadura sp. KC06]|uniref:hypothetical protein n=1 Tax=Actinomadura sp. KC06 TaxID=2530369 RepID=UPI0010492F1C|nr:hypothetical protein [Actinomadura sp. KC06]TDD36212.1 hypothetical protein E1287_11905 [Actinomadura sp. KC06]
MVAQRDGQGEALIPMPKLTVPALRKAVATVAPSRLREFFEDMQKAFDEAGEEGSVFPIRAFYLKWGEFVEIERHPETAERLHTAERAMADADPEVRARAIREIGDIVRAAGRAVAGECLAMGMRSR